MKKETEQKLIEVAKTWLKTPWHHEARVKGAGVDCAQFLIAVFSELGFIDEFQTEKYPHDWHLHRNEKRFLKILLDYAVEVPKGEEQIGDVVMFKYARHESHGAIYLGNNTIIHAWQDEKMVVLSDISFEPLKSRVAGFYRLKSMVNHE